MSQLTAGRQLQGVTQGVHSHMVCRECRAPPRKRMLCVFGVGFFAGLFATLNAKEAGASSAGRYAALPRIPCGRKARGVGARDRRYRPGPGKAINPMPDVNRTRSSQGGHRD